MHSRKFVDVQIHTGSKVQLKAKEPIGNGVTKIEQRGYDAAVQGKNVHTTPRERTDFGKVVVHCRMVFSNVRTSEHKNVKE